jgi:mannose-6-phosphate isomerase-like protein (cupin superfamily)
MLEQIEFDSQVYAIIIRTAYNAEGIKFFTNDDSSQQLGYMNRKKGYQIQPHVHNEVLREVTLTQEVLFIKTGVVRVDFYSQQMEYKMSKVLEKGDVVLLANGGHGFEILEDAEIIEVKQGPYCGERDKVRFESIASELTKIVE